MLLLSSRASALCSFLLICALFHQGSANPQSAATPEPCPSGFTQYAGASPWGCCKGACPAGSEWEDAEALCFFKGSKPSVGDVSCATLVTAQNPHQSSPPEPEPVELIQKTEPAAEEAIVDSEQIASDQTDQEGSSSLWLWFTAIAVAAAGGATFMNKKTTVKRTAILMYGPPAAGKTTLFYTLKDGAVCTGTTSSLKENDATFKLHNSTSDDEDDQVHLIDYPGDPKLSARLADFLPMTKAIVFVLNANAKQDVEAYAAEQMFQLLTNPMVVEHSLPILVACNQSDYPLSSKPPLLRKILETELTKLRETTGKGNATLDLGEDGPESVPLGQEDEDFTFNDHSPCPVSFIACSATKGTKLDEVSTFCREQLLP